MYDIKRGSAYWVDFSDSSGHEIKNVHPALVISNDQQNKYSPLITILPLASKDKIIPFRFKL